MSGIDFKQCKRYGVTFHKNMDVETIVNTWDRVPLPVRLLVPEVDEAMKAAKLAFTLEKTARSIYVKAKKLYDKSQEVTSDSAASLTGNAGQPINKAKTLVEKEALKKKDQAVETAKQKIFNMLCNQPALLAISTTV